MIIIKEKYWKKSGDNVYHLILTEEDKHGFALLQESIQKASKRKHLLRDRLENKKKIQDKSVQRMAKRILGYSDDKQETHTK